MAQEYQRCWGCGNLISRYVARCPKCGWTPGATGGLGSCLLWWVLLIVVMALLLVAGQWLFGTAMPTREGASP
ncbi:MAG TPA: hypothetical protein VFB38_21400 [Chthonomonadaceae bacterium]|nr:hypothetical protein [Chthonomonadaceae bacterium]